MKNDILETFQSVQRPGWQIHSPTINDYIMSQKREEDSLSFTDSLRSLKKKNKMQLPTVLGGVALVSAGVLAQNNSSTAMTFHDSTNFCKMNKDEVVGSTCDVTFKQINDINQQIRPCLLYTSRCV